jgi:hypothetical protein
MSVAPNESWECGNCLAKEGLNVHGRCARCDSDAVFSEQAWNLSREAREVAELEKMVEIGKGGSHGA